MTLHCVSWRLRNKTIESKNQLEAVLASIFSPETHKHTERDWEISNVKCGKILCLFLFYVVTTTQQHRTGVSFSEPFLLYYEYSFNQHNKGGIHNVREREREREISKQYEVWTLCLGLHHYYIYTCTVTLGSKIVTFTGVFLWCIKDKKGKL